MSADSAVPEWLAEYYVRREAERRDDITAVLAGLTDRERGLLHDAAVMGFVQGSRWSGDGDIPMDSEIIAGVVDACLHFRDIYPTISRSRPALPRCSQCGRVGTRGFRTMPADDALGVPAITVCANTTACAKRWPKRRDPDA